MIKSRHFLTGLSLLTLLSIAFLSGGCAQIKEIIGKDKLNQGILKFNQGKTEEALDFFVSASELRPEDAKVWMCLGATKYKMLNKEGLDPRATAQQSLDYYLKALEKAGSDCKTKDNAYGYIATIYGDNFNDEDKRREWLLKRADDACATNDIKAQTFYSIGVKYWQCAYDESTRYADKAKTNSEPFHARNFYNAPDKQKFDDCLAKAFENIEKSISFKADYGEAYSYKSLLWRERQKSTSDEAARKKYDEEAQKEAKIAIKLAEEAKAKAEAEAKAKEAAEGGAK